MSVKRLAGLAVPIHTLQMIRFRMASLGEHKHLVRRGADEKVSWVSTLATDMGRLSRVSVSTMAARSRTLTEAGPIDNCALAILQAGHLRSWDPEGFEDCSWDVAF